VVSLLVSAQGDGTARAGPCPALATGPRAQDLLVTSLATSAFLCGVCAVSLLEVVLSLGEFDVVWGLAGWLLA
jgi:hypothetical protein